LFAAGVTGGALALALGSPVPGLMPVLLLVALVAVAGNRVTLFPSEWSATAETAVLLAAVVGFAGDSPFVGPWVVALTTGPLDVVHWRGRSFSRMAYNSGTRMLAVLLAAGAYGLVDAAPLAPGPLRFGLAALAASVLYATVEVLDYVGYEHVRSRTRPWVAVRDAVRCDPLIVPLGMLGAFAGWLAATEGWLAAAAVLVPTFFVPELVLVRARRAWPGMRTESAIRRAAAVALGGCVVTLVVAFTSVPDAAVLVCVAACAIVVALDLRVDRARVPPVLGAVVAGALLVDPDAALAAGVTVAVVATATAALVDGAPAAWWAPGLAAFAACAGAGAFVVVPTRGGALVAALLFQLVVATRPARMVWLAPLVCCAVAFGGAGRVIGGGGGALVWGAALVVVAVAVTAWGAPPWDSRVLARTGPRRRVGCRVSLLLVVVGSATTGVVAVAVDGDRGLWVATASGLAAAAAAMVAVGVRQWRFVPRRRRRQAGVVLVAALTVVVAYPASARAGSPWSVAVLAAALVAIGGLGWPLAGRIDRGMAHRRAAQRMPESRSASA
jgi:hypothetical protein